MSVFIKPDNKPPHQPDMDSYKPVHRNPKADPQDNAVSNQPHQNIYNNHWNILFRRRIHLVCTDEPRNAPQLEQLSFAHSSHHSHHKLAYTVKCIKVPPFSPFCTCPGSPQGMESYTPYTWGQTACHPHRCSVLLPPHCLYISSTFYSWKGQHTLNRMVGELVIQNVILQAHW